MRLKVPPDEAAQILAWWVEGKRHAWIVKRSGWSTGAVARITKVLPRAPALRLDEELIALMWREGCTNKHHIARAVGATPPGIRQVLRRMGLMEGA